MPDAQAQLGTPTPRIATGAARFAADGFAALRGKRVGLVTNHTGRVGTETLIEAMARAPGVTLAAILTPEHGLTGRVEAGAKVKGERSGSAGVPVHSLYGATLKPTPAMLAGLDVLVFDMQDVGARFYTYISTMGLCMQAATEAGLPLIVLDRPNPLGGEYVAGFVLEKALASFVGHYEIPIAHGLSVGELARMIKGERLLAGLDRLALDVVAMAGWRRGMRWPGTGLPWVPTSPNIPTFETALAYAGTGLFEATTASEGRGTQAPFLTLGHAAVEAREVVERLERARLPGAAFQALRVTPRAIKGVATSPRFRDTEIGAVRVAITDGAAYRPVETGIHLLAAFAALLRANGKRPVADPAFLDKLAGTGRLRQALERGTPAEDVIRAWSAEVARFRAARERYLLYA